MYVSVSHGVLTEAAVRDKFQTQEHLIAIFL